MSSRITGVEDDDGSQKVCIEGVVRLGPRLTQSVTTALALLCRQLPGGVPVRMRFGDRLLPITGVAMERIETENGTEWALVLEPDQPNQYRHWVAARAKRGEP
ncbi:Uncharacterised protein [Mycobacteroides abscessus]|uniref:hypothetical protein n=1 Tax=Mycobacteroides abscessus TaxID=36809 RepID=UPI0005E04F12|nr:hypothetical protein [Mycobacteroides abscessus]CPS10286.1 Uncharacterised protein [Mycobacteroides abscessus]CPS50050.1 Uncharacterised protein [Mycobacteroides abscessus]CPS93836.1 Uncharacterised protein [Mycobacteroides abscessus]CPS94161.1 Uncharacterised protein [Mycobacteroides abscessus]CPT62262.1 Uncharacterised protein [Mycobacteroides abscessus]